MDYEDDDDIEIDEPDDDIEIDEPEAGDYADHYTNKTTGWFNWVNEF